MKKKVMIAAAITVIVGVGVYTGHSFTASADGLDAILVKNAEALSTNEIELPEITITCDGGYIGACHKNNPLYPDEDSRPCLTTGLPTDYCVVE